MGVCSISDVLLVALSSALKPTMAPKAKVKSKKVTRSVSTTVSMITAIVTSVFEDFSTDSSYCQEMAEKVDGVLENVLSADSEALRNALGDALTGYTQVEGELLLGSLYDGLLREGLVVLKTQSQQVCAPAEGVLSSKRFCSIFSKELKKRERAAGPHGVTDEALACLHNWDNSGTAGMACQICVFETKDRSWTCNLGCGVRLCGSCCFKWKTKA